MWFASSPAYADVNATYLLSSDGDTVVIPAGTATWSSQLMVNNAITLHGAGIGQTIIKDNCQGSTQFLRFNLVANKTSRLTGIEFRNGGRTSQAVAPNGFFKVNGSNTDASQFRMDNCKWDGLFGTMVFDTVIGVVDNNTMITSYPFFSIYCTNWNGGLRGDSSWNAATNFGSSQFLFIEDNDFTSTNNRAITDAFAGGRFVIRYNTIHDAVATNHGTEGQRNRGSRAYEVYNNDFRDFSGSNKIVGNNRGGGCLFHDNTFSTFGAVVPVFSLTSTRSFHGEFWGDADGTNPYDVNLPGGPFWTGTALGASSGETVNMSPGLGGTNNWVGYSVKRTTDIGGNGSENFGMIVSNTENSLTWLSGAASYGAQFDIANGDTLQIWKVTDGIDGVGRALGGLMTGGNPPVLPSGWNDQINEPCYSWNNLTPTGEHVNFTSVSPLIRVNAHYKNDTAMPGYTPYVYPHPLVNAGIPTPTPTVSPSASPTSTATSTPTPTPTATATVPPVSPTPATSPTPTPAPSTSPSASPTPVLCEVPGFIGLRLREAMWVWSQAGFDCRNITVPNTGGNPRIKSQSIAAGSQRDCLITTIVVK